jgi:trimeric autotransporter adhesin
MALGDMTDDAPTDSTDGQASATIGVLHLTYGQIGERLGMSADAARQLARRRAWSRTRPNAIGQPVVVAVPAFELTDEHNRPPTDDQPSANRRTTDSTPTEYGASPLENGGNSADDDRRSVLSVTVGALRSAVDLLGQQLQAERRRVDTAQAQIGELHRDLAAAEAAAAEVRAALDAAQQRAGEAEAAADVAQAAQAEAEADVAELRENLEGARRLVAIAQERAAAVEQADAAREAQRRGQGRWARLRAAWRGG